jgi:hypothetical protein
MNDSENEPPDSEANDCNQSLNRSSQTALQTANKRRIWVVVLLFLFGQGLPFAYCGNLKLGIKIAILMAP